MSIVIFLAVLSVDILGAFLMKDAAARKGYGDNLHAWAIYFWLGVIGYLYIIALPDRVVHEQNNKVIYYINKREGSGENQ